MPPITRTIPGLPTVVKKKPFKYYAIRIANTVIIRRTVGQLTVVRSKLYKPGSEFICEQVTYTGGNPVATIGYNSWVAHGGARITKVARITRETYKAMTPFLNVGITKGDVE